MDYLLPPKGRDCRSVGPVRKAYHPSPMHALYTNQLRPTEAAAADIAVQVADDSKEGVPPLQVLDLVPSRVTEGSSADAQSGRCLWQG